jgi:hypothetical protein
MENGLIGKSVALTLQDGNSTTSPDHPLTQTAAMPRKLAAGLDNRSSDLTMAA